MFQSLVNVTTVPVISITALVNVGNSSNDFTSCGLLVQRENRGGPISVRHHTNPYSSVSDDHPGNQTYEETFHVIEFYGAHFISVLHDKNNI